ncbi:MAG: hypothetical protein ACREAX_04770, partial [Candidatus Nitrosotenuis sp.]
ELTLLGVYLAMSILVVNATGRDGHMLKQLVGAKGYGALTLAFGLASFMPIVNENLYLTWFANSSIVFFMWWLIRLKKTEDDFE